MGIIYKIINEITGKIYVGQTSKTLKRRWYEHQSCAKRLITYNLQQAGIIKEITINKVSDIEHSLIYKSMAKHGIDKFTIEKIEEVNDDSLLNELEIKYINELNALQPDGYNLTTGGGVNYKHSEITINRIKEKKRINVDEIRSPLLKGMPQYVIYNKKIGNREEHLLIVKHPLCKYKYFGVLKFGSVEKCKEEIVKFISELEETGVKHVSDYRKGAKRDCPKTKVRSDGLPTYLMKTKFGYMILKTSEPKLYFTFADKNKTNLQLRELAFNFYNSMFKTNFDYLPLNTTNTTQTIIDKSSETKS